MTTGYIFDFDGVLVDSMKAHLTCFNKACSEVGIPVNNDKLVRYNGVPVIRQIEIFAQDSGVQVDPESVFERYYENYTLSSLEVEVIEPIIGIMRALSRAGCKVAIASSGSREHIRTLVDKFGIPCEEIVSFDDVKHGKPDPEIFLTAAARLGVEPENCVVFEDSEIGIEAATRAGMSTLHFRRQHGSYDLTQLKV